MSTYIVRSGDSLSAIATAHGMTVEALLELNPQITDPNRIFPGQTLNLVATEPAPEPVIPVAPSTPTDTPAWLVIAKQEEADGVDEIRGAQDNLRIVEYHQSTTLRATDDETPWCSSFVNWCVQRAGRKGTRSAAARSWLSWGRALTQPCRGCIVVLKRGTNPSQGHVGFFISEEVDRIWILGGNQSNRVCVASYPKARLLNYRWPEDMALPDTPAQPGGPQVPVPPAPGAAPGSAASYNRQAVGSRWHLVDLPPQWPGFAVLQQGDSDRDLVLDDDEIEGIDWIAFAEAVEDFQQAHGVMPVDGKLGPITLKQLQQAFPAPAQEGLLTLGDDLVLSVAQQPTSPPSGPLPLGQTPEERRICRMWSRYGQAIANQAGANGLSTRIALAVFSVESGSAYDPGSGLVILRYEPHVFRRLTDTGQAVPAERGGQAKEWSNLRRAYQVDKRAALLACSYGLPQLMGFNWHVTNFAGPRELLLGFQASCEQQVAGFFQFVQANNLLGFIRQEHWRDFTRRYNGPGNVDVYSGRLVRALKVVDSLAADGARFD